MNVTSDPSEPARRLDKVPSGLGGLDAILRGGFLEGGMTIIQGRPGSGKTIFGNQLCFNHVIAGGRALYVTLLAESHARMLLHIGGLSFFRAEVIPDQLSYVSAFPVLESDGTGGLLTLLRQEMRRRDVTLLVLDGLAAAEQAAGSNMAFKKFIHELQTLASVAGCTMFLLAGSGGDRADVAPEHTMVDCVIELRSRLHGWRAQRTLEILKRRGDGYLRGAHAFRIDDDGIVVFPRFEALLGAPAGGDRGERADGPRASTGLAPLDDMLDGGLPRNSSTLLLGPPGSGKTTLGLHFLSPCSAEEPGLFFGFYETAGVIRAKAEALDLPLARHFATGAVEMLWQPTTEALLDEACARLLAAVRARTVRRLFLDGIGGLLKLADDPDRVGYVLTALFNELRGHRVASVVTKETEDLLGSPWSAPGSGLAGGSVSDIADNILLFQVVRQRSRFWRTVSTFKARDSRIDDRTRLFEIGRHGLAIDPSPDRAEAVLGEAPGDAPGDALGDALGEPDGDNGPPAGGARPEGARPGGAQHWRRRGA